MTIAGKTTLLSYLSALHGIRGGKVQSKCYVKKDFSNLKELVIFLDLNLSKLTQLLTTSSLVFVPVDDPEAHLLNKIAEVGCA